MATKNKEPCNRQIKQRDKSSVNGYIREIEEKSFSNDSFYKIIPMIINYLCMKYYHESRDEFDPELHGTDMKVTDKEVSNMKDCYRSAFLSNIVSKGIHKWKFQSIAGQFIGICNDSVRNEWKYLNDWYYCNTASSSYGLFLKTGQLRGGKKGLYHREKYCPPRSSCGDVIEMCLDLNRMELKFVINDKDYGKAFDVPPGNYRVGVCSHANATGFKLLEYETK